MRWFLIDICLSSQVPVYRGAAESVVETFERAANIHGSDGFGDFEYPDAPQVDKFIQKEHAVNYLTRITAEKPGKIISLMGYILYHSQI